MLTEAKDVTQRWKEYSTELLEDIGGNYTTNNKESQSTQQESENVEKGWRKYLISV